VDTALHWQLLAAEAMERPDSDTGGAAAVRDVARRVPGAERPSASDARH
jgi:hypothetical protein